MSQKKPLEIRFEDKLINPEFVYSGKVVKNGNGASIRSFKKWIGCKVTVIIHAPAYELHERTATTKDSWEDDMSGNGNPYEWKTP